MDTHNIQHAASLSNQMKHRDREMVPRALVIGMFSLMVAATALVAFDSFTDRPILAKAPDSKVLQTRMIQLEGSRSGGVLVTDNTGAKIGHSLENKAGFIDVIWGSILRERTARGINTNNPLRLVRRENGHFAVIDDATSWKIELIGYGKDNVAAFARLID